MSGDSLLKMFLVLQYLRRLDALALHYCRWDCIGKGAKSEVMRATIYGKRLSCALQLDVLKFSQSFKMIQSRNKATIDAHGMFL